MPSGPTTPMTDELDARLAEWGQPEPWLARAGRRDARAKLAAGLLGLKHAFRGDSSFFAHAYRGLLIAMAARLLGVGPSGWCFLVLSAGLVLIAELAPQPRWTLWPARWATLSPPARKAAREIASAGVLVAVVVFAAVSVTVLVLKLNEMLGWWH